MTTLADLKIKYAKSPKTLAAINAAIAQYGASAEATTTAGLPSTTNKASNMHRDATRAGFAKWDYFLGAHRQRGTQGWITVIVKIA